MRMVGTSIDAQLLLHQAAEVILRHHPLDRQLNDTLGILLEHLLERNVLLRPDVARVAEVGLLLGLLAREPYLLSIDDHYVITHIHMRSISGLVLTAQRSEERRVGKGGCG